MHKHPLGLCDVSDVQQLSFYCSPNCGLYPVRALRLSHTYGRKAFPFGDGPEVSVVDVDEARGCDCFGDALDELADQLVRHTECLLQRKVPCNLGQLCVVDCDYRVAVSPEPFETVLCAFVPVPLNRERECHHSDYEPSRPPKFPCEYAC